MKFALLTSFCALGFSLAPKIVHASDYTLQLIPNCSSAISDNKNAVSLIQITESTEIGHFFGRQNVGTTTPDYSLVAHSGGGGFLEDHREGGGFYVLQKSPSLNQSFEVELQKASDQPSHKIVYLQNFLYSSDVVLPISQILARLPKTNLNIQIMSILNRRNLSTSELAYLDKNGYAIAYDKFFRTYLIDRNSQLIFCIQ